MSAQYKVDPNDTGAQVVSPLVNRHAVALDANATDCAISRDGRVCAVSLGDGRINITQLDKAGVPTASKSIACHRVAAVGLHTLGEMFISIGQDGRAVLFNGAEPDGAKDIYAFPDAWIEAIAVSETAGLIALASKSLCVVVDPAGQVLSTTDVGSTISSIAFDAKGGRIVASHYNGVTTITAATGEVELTLEWKGSHTGVSWSPSDRYVVSATQEKELHVWDLITLKDFRMGGYPRKCHQMAWTADGETLACSGADVITAWSFAGSGPSGRPPVEIGFVFGGMVCAVAAHPSKPLVAGGFTSGNVLIGGTVKGEAVVAQAANGEAVTCLAWSPDGDVLIAGNSAGTLSVFSVADHLKVS
ncbi:MAG: WD40 repeat domain-containing protein [Pseudomonadota bacterium]